MATTIPTAIHGDTIVGYAGNAPFQGFIYQSGWYTLFRDPNDGGSLSGTLANGFQGNTIVGAY